MLVCVLLQAIEYWQRAAEAAYAGSSLMEALRLFQKAAGIAEVLAESIGDSEHGGQLNADHSGKVATRMTSCMTSEHAVPVSIISMLTSWPLHMFCRW
jgi:hypothetical protein